MNTAHENPPTPPATYPTPTLQTPLISDTEPDPVYQIDTSRHWQVGDLVRQQGKLILVIAVGLERQHKAPDDAGNWIVVTTFRELICLNETGRVWQSDAPTYRVDFRHSTGLRYDYQSREQVQLDYRNGFFTPYFEIL